MYTWIPIVHAIRTCGLQYAQATGVKARVAVTSPDAQKTHAVQESDAAL